jgi:hypothetical protein
MVFVGGYIAPCCNTGQFNVTDSASPSNNYILGKNQWEYFGGNGRSTLSQFCAIASGTGTLTIKAAMPLDTAYIAIVIAEYSGTTCTVDGTPTGHTDSQTGFNNMTGCDAGAVATTHPNDLVLSAVQYSNSATPTESVSSPWTDQARVATLAFADRAVTTTNTWNPSWSFAATPYSDSCIAIAYQTNATTTGGDTVHVSRIVFRSLSQNTIAGSNFSLPAVNAPSGVSVEGPNSGNATTSAAAWTFGTLSFAANSTPATAQSVQGAIYLSPTWSASAGITLENTWRTSATSGAVVWQIQGQCVGSGAPASFGTPIAMSPSAANPSPFAWTNTATTILSPSDVLAGCSPGNWFLFRLFRDAQNPSDTVNAAAELVASVFGVTQ